MTPQPQHPQRCETCTGPCPVLTGSFFEDRLHREPELARYTVLVGCASHSSARQQRIDAATLKSLIDWLNCYNDDVTFSRSLLKSKIALLQAGDGK